MIKKIGADQLAIGMYIHDLDCGWMSHPFLTTRFAVSSTDIIKKIRNAGIKEIYIDTGKGKDLPGAPTVDEVNKTVTRQTEKAARAQAPLEKKHSIEQEVRQAKLILKDTHTTMRNLMADARVGRLPEMASVVPLVDRMTTSVTRNKDALVSLARIKQKDAYTYMHSVSVCILMVAFARAMGYDRDAIAQIGIGALLYDVGKMMIPNEILNKPGRLTSSEFEKVKDHVVHGYNIISQIPGIDRSVIDIATQHHERVDGSGYPMGLKGDAISELGQMAAIVDVYDALTSDRAYKPGCEASLALKKMVEWSKHHFSEKLVHQFIRTVGIYPVGTLVELNDGRVGVVVEQSEGNLLSPVVRVVYDGKKRQYINPKDIDLSRGKGPGLRITGQASQSKLGINPHMFLQ